MKELFEIKDKYPDLRKYDDLFDNIKTPVCGFKAKDCIINGCNKFCHKQVY